jgi:HK97 family phage prohead protease
MSARTRAARPARCHYRTLGFDVRSVDEKDGSYFEGYCAVHNNIDSYGTIMGRGCFDRDFGFFRDNGFIGGLNHNWDQPLGTPNGKTKADDHGLYVGANVLDTTYGMDVRKLFAAGVIKKMSFGFEDLDRRYLDQREDVERYWDSVSYAPSDEDKDLSKNGALLFTRVRVFEASPVMAPGNERADVTEVRADGSDGPREYTTFESHSLAARDAVEAFCVRAEQLAELRLHDGRSLAPEKRAILRQIRDRAERALAACQPRANRADVAALRRELFDFDISILTP